MTSGDKQNKPLEIGCIGDIAASLKLINYRLDQVDGKLDKLQSNFDSIKTWTTAKAEQCKTHQEQTDELFVKIDGTSDCPAVGISKRVDELEKQGEYLKEVKATATRIQWAGWIALGSFLLWFFITFVLPVVEKVGKHSN